MVSPSRTPRGEASVPIQPRIFRGHPVPIVKFYNNLTAVPDESARHGGRTILHLSGNGENLRHTNFDGANQWGHGFLPGESYVGCDRIHGFLLYRHESQRGFQRIVWSWF